MARPRFVAFYLLCGLAAAWRRCWPTGSAVPMVGASGAISGVMGAYLVLFPRVRVYTLVPLGLLHGRAARLGHARLLDGPAVAVGSVPGADRRRRVLGAPRRVYRRRRLGEGVRAQGSRRAHVATTGNRETAGEATQATDGTVGTGTHGGTEPTEHARREMVWRSAGAAGRLADGCDRETNEPSAFQSGSFVHGHIHQRAAEVAAKRSVFPHAVALD